MKHTYICNFIFSLLIVCQANTYNLETLNLNSYEYNIPKFGKNKNFELNLDTSSHCLLNESIHNTNTKNDDDTNDTNDNNYNYNNNCNNNQYSKYFDAYKINKILNNINIGQNIIYFKNRLNNNFHKFLDKL